MKKLIIFIGIWIILLIISMVFAESINGEFDEFVKNIAEKKGIPKEDIINITEVDPENLPKEVNVKDIDEANLAIYKVESKIDKPIFVVTVSGKKFEKYFATQVYQTRTFLNFGFDGKMNESGFLRIGGVEGNLKKGYVMMRKGSITGIATNLEVIGKDKTGNVEIIIYKNGEEIGLRNVLDASSSGIKVDYDLQSENLITFVPGDIISVYVNVEREIVLRDIINVIEITY